MKINSPYRQAFPILFVIFSLNMFAPVIDGQELAQPSKPALSNEEKAAPTCCSNTDLTETDSRPQASKAPSVASTQTRLSIASKEFFKDILHDQEVIWTSPLHMKRSDSIWVVPFLATTTVMLLTDNRVVASLGNSEDLIDDSRDVSHLGSGSSTFGAAGTLYLLGRFTHNERLKETGSLGIIALIDSSILVTGLKFATGRERPDRVMGDGGFWDGGRSFPSGHAITTWSLATVIANQYPDKPLIRFGAYGLASAVSLSRFTGKNHFPSDVLVGSVLGYLIGRYTVKQHGVTHSNHPLPSLQPYLSKSARGVTLSFRF